MCNIVTKRDKEKDQYMTATYLFKTRNLITLIFMASNTIASTPLRVPYARFLGTKMVGFIILFLQVTQLIISGNRTKQ